MMNLKYAILPLLLLGACSEEPGETPQPDRIEVSVRALQGAASRTSLGDVGDGASGSDQTVRWEQEDRIALWARPAGATGWTLDGQSFTLRSYNDVFSSADFTATIDPMDEGTYTYYAVYPEPSSAAGTQLVYELSAAQSGAYDPALDVMTASTEGCELLPRTGDATQLVPQEQPVLNFAHLFHMMRIRVPRNLLEKPVKRLEIDFPCEVAGQVSFDVTAPETSLSVTDGSSKITLTFPDDALLDASTDDAPQYAWVHILPCTLQGTLSFRAFAADGTPSKLISVSVDREVKAQRITPVSLTVPEAIEPVTVTFRCPDNESYPNFLGENATQLVVKSWPAASDGTEIRSVEGTDITVGSDGIGTARFYYDAEVGINPSLPGARMRVAFRSAHADLSDTEYEIALPATLTVGGTNEVLYALPYLFFEDFSGVTNNNTYDDTNSGSYMDDAGLSGWSGSRWTTVNSSHLELNTYIGSSTSNIDNKFGRADTPPMKLRDGANCTLTISYNISGSQVSGALGTGQTKCVFGTNTDSSAIGGGTGGGTKPSTTIEEFNTDTNGFSTSMPSKSHMVDNCTNATRFAWFTTYTKKSLTLTARSFYLYLDNIKVSVGSEVKHSDLDYRNWFPQ